MSEQTNFGKVLRINLLMVVLGAVVAGLLNPVTQGTSIGVFAIIYLIQVLINCLKGFTRLGNGSAPYFLSSLLVLLIGFGSCSGLLVYFNVNGGPPQ